MQIDASLLQVRRQPHGLKGDGMNLSGRDCVLCVTGKSGAKGEHVLPQWFNERFIPKNSGPDEVYTIEKNGVAVTWPNTDKPIGLKKFFETCIPCCADCNSKLNSRFEQAMANIGYDSATALRNFTAAEAAVLGEWWLKTLLLLVHPEATEPPNTEESTGAGVISWPLQSQDLYNWMRQGFLPPKGLSVYAYRFDAAAQEVQAPDFPIPEVTADNGCFSSYVSLFGLEHLRFIVSYHPGWELDLPSVQEGTLAQLWPARGTLDLSTLVPVPAEPIRFYGVSVLMSEDFDPLNPVVLRGEDDLRDIEKLPNVKAVNIEQTPWKTPQVVNKVHP